MSDLKTMIENRQTELQVAYDSARFKIIELNQRIADTQRLILDQERIIKICKIRAKEQGVFHIL